MNIYGQRRLIVNLALQQIGNLRLQISDPSLNVIEWAKIAKLGALNTGYNEINFAVS